MKKNIIILIFVIFFTLLGFTDSQRANLYFDFNSSFDFSLDYYTKFKDIYETSLNYVFILKNNYVSTSNFDNVFKYLDYSQPGFEITYKNSKNYYDLNFIRNNHDGFNLVVDNNFFLSLKNLEAGYLFKNDCFYFSYWANITNLKSSNINFGFGKNNLAILFQIKNKRNLCYFYLDNIIFSYDFSEIIIYNKNFNFYYNKEKHELSIDSVYFYKNNKDFIFRFPINKNVFLSFSNYGPGISYNLSF